MTALPALDAPVYTVADLVVRWKTTRKTVLQAIADGRLAAFRVGMRTYRVTAEAVDRFERAQAAND